MTKPNVEKILKILNELVISQKDYRNATPLGRQVEVEIAFIGIQSLIQQEIEGFVEYLDQKTSDKKHKFINEVTGEETTLQVADIKDIRKFLGEYLDQRKGKNETH